MFIEMHRREAGSPRGQTRERERERERDSGERGDQCRDKRFRGGSIRIQHLAHASTPESRISGPCKPYEKPLLPARYRLIYSRKVAIVDIKPATPTFIPWTRCACVLARWVVSVDALYTSFNLRQRCFRVCVSHPRVVRETNPRRSLTYALVTFVRVRIVRWKFYFAVE